MQDFDITLDAPIELDIELDAATIQIGHTSFIEDPTSGNVAVTASTDKDLTLTSNALTGITVTIPTGIAHGFYFGLNFKAGAVPPTFAIVNNSGLPLFYIAASDVQTFSLLANGRYQLVFFCDGQSIGCYIGEAV